MSDVEEKKIESGNEDITTSDIPDLIIARANEFLISKVSERFFYSYIKFNHDLSRFSLADTYCIKHPSRCTEFLLKPHYYFVYNFKISEKDFVDEIIEFVTDSLGNVVQSRKLFGIPKCPNNNCCNNFPLIEKEDAIKIAKEYGSEEGLNKWILSFHFFAGDLYNYVWKVKNILYKTDYEFGGKTLLIDANTGRIVQSSS